MCRAIKTLHHFVPPATREEIQASALQYVRKLSGIREPSRANKAVFDHAVEEVARVTMELFASLEAHGPPRTREAEREKAVERGRRREEQNRARVLRELGRRARR